MSKVCIYFASRTPNRGIWKSVLAEILGPVKNTTGRHLFWSTATIRVKIKVLQENLVEGDLQKDLKRKGELY